MQSSFWLPPVKITRAKNALYLFFLTLLLLNETEHLKLDEVYAENIWAVASNGSATLMSWGDGGLEGKLGVFRFDDASVHVLKDQRIKASIPMVAPFEDGFAIIPFVGTQAFILIDKDGAYQSSLQPESFTGWAENMAIKSLYPLPNKTLLLNLAVPAQNLIMVGILSPKNKTIEMVYQQQKGQYTHAFAPIGNAMLRFCNETGEVALIDSQTFQENKILLPGFEPKKKDAKKFKRLARLRPYVNRVSRPYLVGDYLSAAYMIDYDRFGNPVKQIKYTNLILETGSHRFHASTSMILAVHGKKYLVFDPEEKEIILSDHFAITPLER